MPNAGPQETFESDGAAYDEDLQAQLARITALAIGDAPPMTVCGAPGSSIAFVHPPKTAGTSAFADLYAAFHQTMSFNHFHVFNVEELARNASGTKRAFTHYVVSTRDPVSRLRSSFNVWPTAEVERCYPYDGSTELNALFSAPNSTQLNVGRGGAFNAFAESLSFSGACGDWARWAMRSPEAKAVAQTGHIRQNLGAFKGAGLLQQLHDEPQAQLFLVRLDSVDADVRAMLKWLCLDHEHSAHKEPTSSKYEPRGQDTYLSALGYRLLRTELAEEYDTWRELERRAVNGNVKLVDKAIAAGDKLIAAGGGDV
jgi:hypothetical protein